ncbi:MAG: hypothetical protein AABY67_08765 [Nitrospirota bacterium]
MTCHEIKELTVPYLELDLEPSRIRDVTVHLDGCVGCRAEMEAVRQVLVRVKGVAVPDPGDRFWSEFPDKVRRELARERPPIPSGLRKGLTGWPMALAASVLLLVGTWSLKGLFDQGPAPAPSQPRAVAQAPKSAEPELSQLAEADWHQFWDEDPDMALVEMAASLDRQAVDRLFGEI